MWSVWFFSQIFIAYFINLFAFSKCTYLTDFLSVYSYLNLNSKTLNSCRDKLGIIGLVVIPSFPRSWSWSRSHYQNSLLLCSWRLYQRLSTMRIFNPRPVLIHNMGKVACVAWRFCRAHYGAEKTQKCTQKRANERRSQSPRSVTALAHLGLLCTPDENRHATAGYGKGLSSTAADMTSRKFGIEALD